MQFLPTDGVLYMMRDFPTAKTPTMLPVHFVVISVLALATSGILGCGGKGPGGRNYQTPDVERVITELQQRQSRADSFMAESRMEYWVDGKRIKPTVYVMGERGAKVRFNALNPAGDDVAADLACNGSDFQYVDFNRDCQLTGPCTKDAISQLLRISLRPDDFLLLAIGSTPLIEDASGKVVWDSKNQQEKVTLVSGDGNWKQEIRLEGKEQRWDVLSSTVWNAKGEIEWKITNKEFAAHKAKDGQSFRLPGKTRFEQPKEKAEVTIRWQEREINATLSAEKFTMDIPALPRCGE
jgi:outer membrane lipoprotein-sorting protein